MSDEIKRAAERLIAFSIADDEYYRSGHSRTVHVDPLQVASVVDNGRQRATITMANGDKFYVCAFIDVATAINEAAAALTAAKGAS